MKPDKRITVTIELAHFTRLEAEMVQVGVQQGVAMALDAMGMSAGKQVSTIKLVDETTN